MWSRERSILLSNDLYTVIRGHTQSPRSLTVEQ